MKKIILYIICITSFLLMNSCKKKETVNNSELFNYIPQNATIVVNLNTGELRKKIDWDYVNSNPLLAMAKVGLQRNILSKFINNADETGINFNSEIILYTILDSTAQTEYVYAVMEMKDKNKFEEMIKAFTKTETFSTEDNYSGCSGQGIFAGWNNDVVIIVSNPDEMNTDGAYLSAMVKNAFSVSNPLGETNASFKEIMSENSDVDIWADTRMLIGSFIVRDDNLASQKTDMFYSINFNKGDVSATIKTKPKDAKGKEILEGLFNKKPDQNLNMFLPDQYELLFHISADPPKAINAIEQLTGKSVISKIKEDMDSTITSEQVQMLINQIGGEGVAAVDFSFDKKDPSFIAILNTTSDTALQYFTKFNKEYEIVNDGSYLRLQKPYDDTTYAFQQNKIVFLSNQKKLIDECSDSKETMRSIPDDILTAMQNDPFVFYADIKSITSHTGEDMKFEMFGTALNLFENASIIAEPVKGDIHHTEMKLSVTDKEDWSINFIIKTLLETFGNNFKFN